MLNKHGVLPTRYLMKNTSNEIFNHSVVVEKNLSFFTGLYPELFKYNRSVVKADLKHYYFVAFTLFIISLFLPFNFLIAQEPKTDNQAVMTAKEINTRLSEIGRMYDLDSTALARYDKIITFKREVFVGKIYNITFADVRFTCPPDNSLKTITKSEISQILYGDGRRDVFIALEGRNVKQKELVDTSRIIVKNQKDWMKVRVTEEPDDIINLTLKGTIKANYEADVGNATNDELMKRARTILMKKAAMLNAHMVLIETKFFTKPYGELPKIEVIARAFGY